MTSRTHIVLDEARKARYRSEAAREGKSLGAWMREAAEEKMARSAPRRFASVQEFDEFIAECQARSAAGGGFEREPDWEETRKVILDAKIGGLEEGP